MIDLTQRITIDPAVRGGKPCIRETRITVYDILEYLAGGMSEAEILADFPSLKLDDLKAALLFAARQPVPGQSRCQATRRTDLQRPRLHPLCRAESAGAFRGRA